jgi:hypothetical protein
MARTISWRGVLSPEGPGDGRPDPRLWRPTTPLVPPRSILEASRLMQFGAVLSVAEVVRAFATRADLRAAFAREAAAEAITVTGADLDRVVTVSLTTSTIAGLVGAVLWVVMSRATARGSRWGRLVACLLWALGFGVFAGGLLATAGPLARALALAQLFIGGWALVRLWHRDSSAYIRFQTTAQD